MIDDEKDANQKQTDFLQAMIGEQDDQIESKIEDVETHLCKKVEKNQDLMEFFVDLRCQNSI